MIPEIKKGIAVISKKGRDKGRVFVVLYTVDADFALICDGDTRKLDHPKRKSRKHLRALPHEFPLLIEAAENGSLKDSDIREALASVELK